MNKEKETNQETNRLLTVENKLMVTRGEVGGWAEKQVKGF